ncbi:Ketosteroid isomerase-related protein [Nonomuraea solani]|uniref:Ketosteroid isomerase-related protein n=1 Tax=Nonomuraea solani TaxID=1144553 RepID=A0A1H6ELY9_9ACTN|nr:nuclear transport factor 2 family protein [Nonomuraea solani]SEG97809.1 Ketosteroid isomerase-related protein [Nonomuraea solani]
MQKAMHTIVERLGEAIRTMSIDAFLDAFADDAVYELRFAMPGQPRKFAGIDAIRTHMKARTEGGIAQMLSFGEMNTTVYESADPELIVVEFEPAGKARGSGTPFRFASSLGVIRVRDGAIVSYLDYPNPLGAAEAARMLPQLGALLAGSPPASGAREVAEKLIRASAANDHEALLALYAPDAVIEIPFAPPGVPKRSAGRDRLRTRLEAVRELRRFDRAEVMSIRETTDPEVVVAEYTLHGRVTATGEPFAMTYLMVLTVRDGLIVHSRDYGDPLAAATLLREAPGLNLGRD